MVTLIPFRFRCSVLRFPCAKRSAPRTAAFTLIELLAVMAIMGLLLGISVMAFKDMGRGAGMRGASIQFKSNLSLARQQAITKRTPIRVIFANTNDVTGWRGMFYLADTSDNLIGSVNYFSRSIQFFELKNDIITVLASEEHVEFRADGSCDVDKKDSGQPRRTIFVGETGGRGMTNQFRIYEKTGRVKVLTETLN